MKLSEFNPTEEVLERAGKCTTAEELVALAQEYDVKLTAEEISDILKHNSLIELNDEQLDQIAGGDDWGDQKGEKLPSGHGRHIGKYEAQGYIGRKVYCVNDKDTAKYCWGILTNSYEADDWLRTVRSHDILVEGFSANAEFTAWTRVIKKPVVNQTLEGISGSFATLFLYDKN